jgi:CRP-like cAMP-binding protein
LGKENASIQQLINYFKHLFPLNDKELGEIISRLAARTIRRKQFILQDGDVCRHFTFVVSGCFKMFAVDKNGKEHNLQFAAENDWITDLSSFYSEKASTVFIEAVEPSEILQIKHHDLLYLYVNYHKIDHNFRVIIERKYIEMQNRVLQSISSTAEERYLTFLQQYSNLSGRLPNTQIASYLGITPEFLSKIRREITIRA